MLKHIDIFIDSKKVEDYKEEFMKTLEGFNGKAKKWIDKNNYNPDVYILKPTVTWTNEKPYTMQYKLEVMKVIKEE